MSIAHSLSVFQAFNDFYVPTRKEVVEEEAPKNVSMFRRIWGGSSK